MTNRGLQNIACILAVLTTITGCRSLVIDLKNESGQNVIIKQCIAGDETDDAFDCVSGATSIVLLQNEIAELQPSRNTTILIGDKKYRYGSLYRGLDGTKYIEGVHPYRIRMSLRPDLAIYAIAARLSVKSNNLSQPDHYPLRP